MQTTINGKRVSGVLILALYLPTLIPFILGIFYYGLSSEFISSLFHFGFYSLPPFISILSFVINVFLFIKLCKTNKKGYLISMIALLMAIYLAIPVMALLGY